MSRASTIAVWTECKESQLDSLGDQSFEVHKVSDRKFPSMSIRLDKAKRRMSGYWKFNAFSLVEKNFQDQLELTLKTKLTVAIIRNSWWIYIKN